MKKCKHSDNSEPQTRRTQTIMTPECALKMLKEGNNRFVEGLTLRRNLRYQVKVTSSGQYPFAIVLSCVDSRVGTELIFDQGIGDIFNACIAGNFVNNDILGSMEFAYTAGIKLVLVLGHTSCGAINAAINSCQKEKNDKVDEDKCSHIEPMIKNLCPAVEGTKYLENECGKDYERRVAEKNVKLNIEKIREESKCLRKAEKDGIIAILGGIYNVASGRATFFKDEPKNHSSKK